MASRRKLSHGSDAGDKHEFSSSNKSLLSRIEVMTIPGPKLGVTGEGLTKWIENVRSTATEFIGKYGKQLGLHDKLVHSIPALISPDDRPGNMSVRDVEKQNKSILDRHFADKVHIETKFESLYPKIWNSMTLSLQEKMKSYPSWRPIDTECDSFGLTMLAISTASNQTTVLEIDLVKQLKSYVNHTTRTNLSSSSQELSEKAEQLASLQYKLYVKRNDDDDVIPYKQFKSMVCYDSLSSAIFLQSVRSSSMFQSAASHVIAESVRDTDSFPSSISSMVEAISVFNSAQTQTKQTSDTDDLPPQTGKTKNKDTGKTRTSIMRTRTRSSSRSRL